MTPTAMAAQITGRKGTSMTLTVSEDAIKDYLRQIGGTALLTGAEEFALGERIAAGVEAQQRLEESLSAAIELGTAERRALRGAIADGQRARDHMVQANLR